MKTISEHAEREGTVIKNTIILRSKTMIYEDEYEIIDNDIGNYDNSFQPGSFGGSSQVKLENAVDDILVATGRFYKQRPPSFQEIMNSR